MRYVRCVWTADLLRGVHAGYVAFVLSAPLVLIGSALLSIRPLHGLPLRLLHLLALSFVAVQLALDLPCPLSVLENRLRGLPPETPFLPALPTPLTVGVVALYLGLSLVGHLLARRAPRTSSS